MLQLGYERHKRVDNAVISYNVALSACCGEEELSTKGNRGIILPCYGSRSDDIAARYLVRNEAKAETASIVTDAT